MSISPVSQKSSNNPSRRSSPNVLPFLVQIETKSKLQQIKEAIHEAATDSTAHSIPHMFKRDNVILKVFWFICLLAATGVCAWMVSSSILDYMSYDTVSKTENVLEIPATFPTISFCNMNPFVTNSSIDFVKNLFIKNGVIDPASNTSENFFDYFTSDLLVVYKYFAVLNALSPNLTDTERMSLGYRLEDIMISCTFDLIKCTANDFEWYFDSYYGYKLI